MSSRRLFLAVLVLALSRVGVGLGAAEKPNILYIMSDDHAAHAIGAYGGRLAKLDPTPTIDRLAREGMRFDNVFCTNSICTPSRACVLTGQYPHRNGVYDLGGRLEPAKQTLAHAMRAAGYHTAMIGKWHLKAEPAAFDYYCVLPGQGKYHDPEFRVRGDKPWPKSRERYPGMHSSDAITDISLRWLEKGWDRSKPFFLMHHFKAPHDYFEYAERYASYLADVEIPAPASLWELPSRFGSIATRGADDELVPHIGTSIGKRNPRRSYFRDFNVDPALSERAAKKAAYEIYLRNYLRCVKGIDDNLARLFAYLKKSGLLDKTLIVYTSDQGFLLGEHDFQDKRWMYEESLRMPFLVRYPPVIKAGGRSDAIVENVDFAPTLLDFAGAAAPASMQGSSFKSICLTGREPAGWKQASYYRYWMHMAHHDVPAHLGIRTKTKKLIFYYGANYKGGYRTPPGWELYDLARDPYELVDVYDQPAYAETVRRLKQELAALRRKVGDTGEDYPECERIIQRFWDYDEADRAEARELSHLFLKRRLEELVRRDARAKRRRKRKRS